MHFQPGEGPIRGLLRDCENFADAWYVCSFRWYINCGEVLEPSAGWAPPPTTQINLRHSVMKMETRDAVML